MPIGTVKVLKPIDAFILLVNQLLLQKYIV